MDEDVARPLAYLWGRSLACEMLLRTLYALVYQDRRDGELFEDVERLVASMDEIGMPYGTRGEGAVLDIAAEELRDFASQVQTRLDNMKGKGKS